MNEVEELKRLRNLAEEAVADMPDGDLKTKAFEIFLKTKLEVSTTSKKERKASKRKKRSTGKRKKESRTKIRILSLKSYNFFDHPKSANDIIEELAKRGYHYKQYNLTWALQSLAKSGELRRIKIKEGDTKREVWGYVNP